MDKKNRDEFLKFIGEEFLKAIYEVTEGEKKGTKRKSRKRDILISISDKLFEFHKQGYTNKQIADYIKESFGETISSSYISLFLKKLHRHKESPKEDFLKTIEKQIRELRNNGSSYKQISEYIKNQYQREISPVYIRLFLSGKLKK